MTDGVMMTFIKKNVPCHCKTESMSSYKTESPLINLINRLGNHRHSARDGGRDKGLKPPTSNYII